jgi:general secretion pathway protein A
MSQRELLGYVAAELGASAADAQPTSAEESVRRLQRFLADNAAHGRQAVIAIDEAHLLLDTGGLETLRLLLNFEPQARPALTLLLVGQPGLLPALDRMPSLEERLGVKCLLRPLTLVETASYVSHRLAAAGSTREIFTPEALTMLHRLTLGNPRRVNRLCDLALLIGFAEELKNIGPAQLEAISDELVTITPEG